MFRDPTRIEQSDDGSLSERSKAVFSPPLSETASARGLENQVAPLMPDTQANPEFAKWWKRWASRVRRISVRKNPAARRTTMDPRNSDPTKAAQPISAECEFKRYL